MIVPENGLVFDIGAHHGESADMYLAAGARVICVEADLQNYLKLVSKHGTNERVVCLHAAVWWSNTVKSLTRTDDQDGLCTLMGETWKQLYPQMRWSSGSDVVTITLRDLMLRYGIPSYVKIDTEGAERQAIVSLGDHKPEALSFEFHRTQLDEALTCLHLLRAKDYRRALLMPAELYISDPQLVHSCTSTERVLHQLQHEAPEWGNILVLR